MGIIADAREIADLVQKIGDLDLYRKIVDLQGEVTELAGRNVELEAECRELQARLAQRTSIRFREPYCWVDGDAVPFCPKCWESEGKQVHLPPLVHWSDGHGRKCRTCEQVFMETRESAVFGVSRPSVFQHLIDNEY